mmetsp:Transcript_19709/g.29940  ORF Transcript_19709/g.29940 Transcript_19709/m.29940 type:complete len:421 (+) Transcript_19709:182-1444(+)
MLSRFVSRCFLLMTLVQSEIDEEKRTNTLSFVRCQRGIRQEKYAAAWFVSRKYIEAIPEIEGVRLRKLGTMMEAASFVMLEGRGEHRPVSYKSLDLLDFFVVHLSWYERRLVVATKRNKELGIVARSGLAARVLNAAKSVKKRPNFIRRKIVAVMPYYARGRGQGPSSLPMRTVYLNATLTTVRQFARPVVCVENEFDFSAVSSFQLFDLLYLPSPSPDKLGLASLLAIHRLINGLPFSRHESWWRNESALPIGSSKGAFRWHSVDYIFYTEADQLPTLRALAPILRLIDSDPQHAIILPRRALPLPVSNDYQNEPFLTETEELQTNTKLDEILISDLIHNNATKKKKVACCFSGNKADACKQVGLIDRHEFASRGLRLFRQSPDAFALLPGEGNFLKMIFRPCIYGAYIPPRLGGLCLK